MNKRLPRAKKKQIEYSRIKRLEKFADNADKHFLYYCHALSRDLEAVGLPPIWEYFICETKPEMRAAECVLHNGRETFLLILRDAKINNRPSLPRAEIWHRLKQSFRRHKPFYDYKVKIGRLWRGEIVPIGDYGL